MDKNFNVLEDVKKILNESFKMSNEEIDKDTLLLNGGLYLNSLQIIELTVAIEDYYEKEFDSELLLPENFESVKSLVNLIENNILNK